jgi:hypothetical protein
MRRTRSLLAGASLLALALAPLPALAAPASAQPAPEPCANQDVLQVPGAEMQRVECHSDLTATTLVAKGRSDISDWGVLHSRQSRNPSAGPGIQVDGYFPDDSKNNGTYGWNHDAQFVMRFPANWNGQLVITGAPGIRKQYSMDYLVSDWVLSQGYAYASTDKGNNGTSFYNNGERSAPGQAVREWHDRVSELTIAAKQVVEQRYGKPADRTWMTGISNSGYLTRWQLENRPELFDGGVDWEGTLFTADGPNLFTYLPTALRDYPQAQLDPAARQRMYDVGFEPGSEILWPDHYTIYWDLTQRVFREAFDPEYDGSRKAGTPFCRTGGAPGTTTACDAQYDYASRPQEVKDAVASVSLTGNIGKPMLTLHGTLDALLPIKTDSDVYTEMINDAGKGGMHRYYVIEDGTHVDDRYDLYPTVVRPILPCYREAFLRLTSWVTTGEEPPASQTVARPASGDVANTCPELAAAQVAAPGAGAPTTGAPTTGAPTTGTAATGTAATGSGAATTAPQGSATQARSGSRSLAATGSEAALPVLALLAVLGAAVLRRRTSAG